MVSYKVLFLVLLLGSFSVFGFADSDGVWHYAKDVRGGIFGSDEVTTGFGFNSQVNFSGGVKVGSGICVLLETDAGGVISCNTTPLTLQGISDRGNTTNKQLSVPSIADYNDATFGLDPSSSSFLKTLYSDTIRVNTIKSCSGKIATDAQGGLYCGVDAVNDADANPANEIQTLSIAGSTLTISSGNSVVLPTVSEVDPEVGTISSNYVPKWDGSVLTTGSISDSFGNIGIGVPIPSYKLDVTGNTRITGNVGVNAIPSINYGMNLVSSNIGVKIVSTNVGIDSRGNGSGALFVDSNAVAPTAVWLGYETGGKGYSVYGQGIVRGSQFCGTTGDCIDLKLVCYQPDPVHYSTFTQGNSRWAAHDLAEEFNIQTTTIQDTGIYGMYNCYDLNNGNTQSLKNPNGAWGSGNSWVWGGASYTSATLQTALENNLRQIYAKAGFSVKTITWTGNWWYNDLRSGCGGDTIPYAEWSLDVTFNEVCHLYR